MPEVVTHGRRIPETGSLVKHNLRLTLLDKGRYNGGTLDQLLAG